MSTILIGSVIANKPFNGGNAWAVFNWVKGLQKLGHRVYLLEQIAPQGCVDAAGRQAPFEQSANLDYFKRVVAGFGMADAAALIYDGGAQTHGLTYAEVIDLAAEADLLVNVTGHLTLEPIKSRVRRSVYLDFDPGYIQFWHAAGYTNLGLEGHDDYYTIGENIGTADCAIPVAGLLWRHTRQPIVLDQQPACEAPSPLRFTTVASWRGGYGRVSYEGKTFGLKAHEFRKIVTLPQRTGMPFELALEIYPGDARDRALLESHGWRIVDPRAVAADPPSFDRYIRTSGAECSAAQGIYVETNSGWFSDRTARYLAWGKPALVQETGFSRNLPSGEGLVLFRTLDEAIDGAAAIARDYAHHAGAARQLAELYFDADVILGRFLDETM